MIKFEYTEVMNFAGAFRGMRNAFESWDKSDSGFKPVVVSPLYDTRIEFVIGPNDLVLAQKLIKAGSDHRKFMRQILVSVDITAPLYWWKEFDTYKVGTVANSCSTMHTLHKRELTLEDFSVEHMNEPSKKFTVCIIDQLNFLREEFIEARYKTDWYSMIQLLPTSYNQRRTLTLSYEVLRNIYVSRRNHKLDEWSVGFMEWIDSLPYADELIKYGG